MGVDHARRDFRPQLRSRRARCGAEADQRAPSWVELPVHQDSCTVACQLSREYRPADGALRGTDPAHSTAEIPYIAQRDAIRLLRGIRCSTTRLTGLVQAVLCLEPASSG
jgi:hypothetical protein